LHQSRATPAVDPLHAHETKICESSSCDIAFPRLRVAVFLDGCFWHGCDPHSPSVKKNVHFWHEKIQQNKHRDKATTAHLHALGWVVLRFCEHHAAERYRRNDILRSCGCEGCLSM